MHGNNCTLTGHTTWQAHHSIHPPWGVWCRPWCRQNKTKWFCWTFADPHKNSTWNDLVSVQNSKMHCEVLHSLHALVLIQNDVMDWKSAQWSTALSACSCPHSKWCYRRFARSIWMASSLCLLYEAKNTNHLSGPWILAKSFGRVRLHPGPGKCNISHLSMWWSKMQMFQEVCCGSVVHSLQTPRGGWMLCWACHVACPLLMQEALARYDLLSRAPLFGLPC